MYMNTKSPHCTVYPGVPSSETPFKEGIYQRDDPHSWGFYTHTGLSPPIRGFVKSARLWLYDNFEQCMKHYAVGVFFPHDLFSFHSTVFPSLVTHCSLHPPTVREGMCLIACVHTECCIWTFESKLAAFYNGDNIMSFGCRFAQLHFWFFFLLCFVAFLWFYFE